MYVKFKVILIYYLFKKKRRERITAEIVNFINIRDRIYKKLRRNKKNLQIQSMYKNDGNTILTLVKKATQVEELKLKIKEESEARTRGARQESQVRTFRIAKRKVILYKLAGTRRKIPRINMVMSRKFPANLTNLGNAAMYAFVLLI